MIKPESRGTVDWQSADNAHFLHPFTDYKALHAEGAKIQVRASGIHMWDSDGNRIIDGLAGLGCVNIGYGRPELARAAAAQMEQLSFCQSFFRTSHPSAIMLAERLVELSPAGLNHVFFSTSGSESNETCMKLVRRFWDLSGKPEKNIFISRENAYHGSTIACGTLSGIPPIHGGAGTLTLERVAHIRAPYWYLYGDGRSPDEFGIAAARWLEEKILELGPDRVAAFFAEPMQGAGGAIIPPSTYWPEVQRICRKHDVLLVVDEIVTGFGRTGKWFGSQHFNITGLDLMSVAKGITSAYVPLSAALVSDRVADVLIERGGEFFHGFTHSAHPVACAVALENIRIMQAERIIEHAESVSPSFADQVRRLADHPLVGDARSCGLFAGLQLVKDKKAKTLFPEEATVGDRCSREALKRGLALRSIGDTMALMPPLIIEEHQIAEMFSITRAALDATYAQVT